MKKILIILLLVGCRSDQQIADEVIAHRAMLKSVEGSVIKAIKDDGLEIEVYLENGKIIRMDSIKYIEVKVEDLGQ